MSKTIFTVTWQQQSFRFPCLQTYALLMILVAAVQQHRKKKKESKKLTQCHLRGRLRKIMINVQASSDDNNIGSSGTDKQQMGICVVGVKSPCNVDSNSPK
jgi:hypothetical protein